MGRFHVHIPMLKLQRTEGFVCQIRWRFSSCIVRLTQINYLWVTYWWQTWIVFELSQVIYWKVIKVWTRISLEMEDDQRPNDDEWVASHILHAQVQHRMHKKSMLEYMKTDLHEFNILSFISALCWLSSVSSWLNSKVCGLKFWAISGLSLLLRNQVMVEG